MSQKVLVWKASGRIPEIAWRTRPSKRSVGVVRARLGPSAADSLTHARVDWRPASEVLSDARRSPVPMDDPDVQRHAERAREGRLLHPVIVDGHTLIDGEHRVSLAFHQNPETRVPVLTVRAESDVMSKKSKIKKVQKSATRPSEVSEWREYGSRGGAVDEAVSGAHDRPDEEELNADVAQIRRENPGLSPYQAHMQAAHRAGDDSRAAARKSDPLAGLADSLTELRTEVRRAEMSPGQRQVVRKAVAEADLRYLRHVRPWSVSDDTELVRKAQDDDARIRKAAEIRAADPNISMFEAMRRARI